MIRGTMGQRFFFGRHLHFASPSRATVASVALFALVCSCSAFGSEIHDAVRNGDTEKVRALLKDNPAFVCSKDDKGLTPLHQAAAHGHADMAALLLDSQACVNATAIDGSTPLHAAATHGHSDIAELLLTNKAQVNTRTNGGLTPLHLASLLDHRDVAVLLLDNQADVNSKSGAGVSDENGPAIHVLSVLLGAGVTIAHTRSYGGGATPLHLAALSGHKDLAEILLAHGADVNAKDNSGKTPLQLAKRRKDVAGLLRLHGGR
jgi:ankyrin repeat protein